MKPFPLILALILALPPFLASQEIALKNLARIQGQRTHRLMGYGLVTGLNGTGDKSDLTLKMAKNLFRRMGMIDISETDFKAKNLASVMVTAELPNFTRSGDNFDVTLSSLGDAKSLKGGILLPAFLRGGDNNNYAQAQGSLSIGNAESTTGGGGNKGHETVATIPNGGILERDFPYDFQQFQNPLGLVLHQPDFTTVSRVVQAINLHFQKELATAVDSAFLQVAVPLSFKDHFVDFVAQLEAIKIQPATIARVVVNEKTGTVVFGAEVVVTPIVLAHGDLKIEVGSGAAGKDKEGRLIPINGGESIGKLVESLNAIGVKPRDLIAILQALKTQGALKAELVLI